MIIPHVQVLFISYLCLSEFSRETKKYKISKLVLYVFFWKTQKKSYERSHSYENIIFNVWACELAVLCVFLIEKEVYSMSERT